MEKTLKDWANDALTVQNASNLCGVAQSFAQLQLFLRNKMNLGSEEAAYHPISKMFLLKMGDLAGITYSAAEWFNWQTTESEVKRMAQ